MPWAEEAKATALRALQAKLRLPERLSTSEAHAISHELCLLDLGHLAFEASQRRHKGQVSYLESRIVRMAAPLGEPLSAALILERAAATITPTTTELHLGAIHSHAFPFALLLHSLKALRQEFPQLRIRALGAPELLQYARLSGLGLDEILWQLKATGAEYIDGRGAAARHPQQGLSFDEWLAVHRRAHQLGLVSDAAIGYWAGESRSTLVERLLAIRTLQAETGGFVSLIPLATYSQEADTGFHRSTPGTEDLRTFALARLIVDNIANIRAHWGRLGMDIAQLSLEFGANELEGAVSIARNSRLAGTRPFRAMNRNELESLIRKTGLSPLERDGYYRSIRPLEKRPSADVQIALECLLYKAEKAHRLSDEEAISIAQQAPLSAIAYCASILKRRHIPLTQASFTLTSWELERYILGDHSALDLSIPAASPSRLASLDLGILRRDGVEVDLETIMRFLHALKHRDGSIQLVLKGVRSLFIIARQAGMTLERLLMMLRTTRLTSIESSSYEGEDDLTISEVVEAHSCIHAQDIPSVAKVELQAPYNGTAQPFWESFVPRLQALVRLQESTHGLLGIKIEAASGSHISAAEYLRSVALARILCHNIPNIIAPFHRLPSLAQSPNLLRPSRSRDALKLAPMAIQCGANDIDDLRLASANAPLIGTELQKSGLDPHLRDSCFHALTHYHHDLF